MIEEQKGDFRRKKESGPKEVVSLEFRVLSVEFKTMNEN